MQNVPLPSEANILPATGLDRDTKNALLAGRVVFQCLSSAHSTSAVLLN